MNIASRLCDNASPGEILISRSVYDHFSGKLCQQVQPGGGTLGENNKYSTLYPILNVVCV